jgi:hypothetical protein
MELHSQRWFMTLALTSAACGSSPDRDREPEVNPAKPKLEVRSERADCKHVTAGELRGRAQLAVGYSVQLSLALPVAWPTANEGVMFLAYPSETLPTGMQRTRLRSPSHRIVFSPASAEPRVEPLGTTTVLGTQDEMAEPVDPALVARAEQAMVDIVSGCRTAEQATTDIQPYLQWLDHEPVIARDLDHRSGTFMGWLRTR